jgi:hypothetical protein
MIEENRSDLITELKVPGIYSDFLSEGDLGVKK